MTKIAALLLLLASNFVLAAGGGALQHAGTDVSNKASLQRGAQLFVNYCLSCHTAKYMRYSRVAEDLGLSEQQMTENLILTGAKIGETMTVAMRPDDAAAWFGAAPPDLSLTARSRGVDWIYTYLKSFYLDPTRPVGWNNTLFANASMPHVLWELQGVQRPVFDDKGHVTGLTLDRPGTLDAAGYDRAIRDLTTFMEYVGEPAVLKRESIGLWVLLYLSLFTLIAWMLKHEYWRDVH